MRALLTLAVLTLSACSFGQQRVTLWSDSGNHIACTLSNDRGSWTMTTPGTVTVLISTKPLAVKCDTPGATGAVSIGTRNYSGNVRFDLGKTP
jgi:hypothetical protein